jgi:signal transduction histidine kinase
VEHGEPPIEVTAAPAGRGERVAVVVRDHGVGVEPDAALLLFERFSPLARRTPDSTGLGLSIARDLARAMGGDLTYERADPGSAFVVELPARAKAS